MTRTSFATWVAVFLIAFVWAGTAWAEFFAFESGQVRPLALTPDGSKLLALDTPDARLEIFRVEGGSLVRFASVPVGLEPVAVAAHTNSEVWVANLLSDSISIVDITATPPRVVRTLLVGDEPRDIVFAGPKDDGGFFRRAFITTARLGQNLPASIPMNLTTPGTPRALVWVFDTANLGATLGGTPETILQLFGDTPRALAASPGGDAVYAAIFQSGNRTTTVTDGAVCDGGAEIAACAIDGVQVPGGLPNGQAPGGMPAPNQNLIEHIPAPEVGLIVKFDPGSNQWRDELGRNWNNGVRFTLPDRDVFRIDALANPPRETASFTGVGTILFNIAVHPTNGRVYVSNLEALNEVRFEGEGIGTTSVRGHHDETRITVLDGESVRPRHLNKHIAALPQGYKTRPMPAAVKDASLSTPLDMVIDAGGTLYVAAFGSSKIGIFETSELDDDSFVPSPAQHIEVSGGGPSGLALDPANQRLYVLTRFDNAVKVIDTASRREIAAHRLYNPEPPAVVHGRPFLYDARSTSSNGEVSCASCHIFADVDQLAWDIGDPGALERPNPNFLGPTGGNAPFHPMKGPMTTQTLRGLKNQGPMHWRGDRTGGTHVGDQGARDTVKAFLSFNHAFGSLMGREEGEIPEEDMEAFTEFTLELQPPPNPVRSLDNQLTSAQAAGRAIFRDRGIVTDGSASCRGCHTLNAAQGNFGTGGATTFDTETQEFKVPQMKNAYQKVGMFGTPNTLLLNIAPEHAAFQGDQIRGFGFLHDGASATVFDFLRMRVFILTDLQRRNLEDFIHAFDTTFAPIVGQQITLTSTNAAAVGPRIDLMLARARTEFDLIDHDEVHECDLVAHTVAGGIPRGYLFDPASDSFHGDRVNEDPLTDAQLRALAGVPGQEVTYLCAPPSEGVRLGLDRDSDGDFDQDEIDSGTDPTNPDDPVVRTPTRTASPTRTPAPPDCAGDCNFDGLATLGELRIGVGVALEVKAIEYCLQLDRDHDKHIDVTDLVLAVTQEPMCN